MRKNEEKKKEKERRQRYIDRDRERERGEGFCGYNVRGKSFEDKFVQEDIRLVHIFIEFMCDL